MPRHRSARRRRSCALRRLGGTGRRRVLQLRTPFGGGKTHTLLALYHLATARDRAREVPELTGVPDPGETRVAVLSGEYLDPQRGRQIDGRTITTLWGELAFSARRLGSLRAAARRRRRGGAAGGELLSELLAGPPTLVLLDEVLIYVVKGRALRRGDTTAGQEMMVFLQNLT